MILFRYAKQIPIKYAALGIRVGIGVGRGMWSVLGYGRPARGRVGSGNILSSVLGEGMVGVGGA
jgi:hypothetical protein